MVAAAGRFLLRVVPGPIVRLRAIVWTIVFSALMPWGSVGAQTAPGVDEHADHSFSIHGRVLNQISKEPVGGALVYSSNEQYATLTDDHGRFEFKFQLRKEEAEQGQNSPPDASGLQLLRIYGSTVFRARKPGFLDNENFPHPRRIAPNESEVTLYLEPESLIVGRVNIPGSAGEVKIQLELFREETIQGREHWVSAGNSRTWADGEFRFFDLTAGTYKLISHEQLDRDPFIPVPGAQAFGFPPVFYPGSSDFSAATPIQLTAGQTIQANFSVTRREYYSVKIPVMNAGVGEPVNVRVYPLGYPSPGYSLTYNPGDQTIQGMLPDGEYTVEADTAGQRDATGSVNLSVHGAELTGATLNLIPNAIVTVNVREEFQSGQSAFEEGSQGPSGGQSQDARGMQLGVEVTLSPLEEFASGQDVSSQPAEGTGDHTLVIENVRPGQYRLNVETADGYAARVEAGGVDLLHQPFTLSAGGSNPPIEVTVRDDGAEVDGTVENAGNADQNPDGSGEFEPQNFVYFLPVAGSTGQLREVIAGPDGSFAQEQLPPGTYLVLAFDREREDLASWSEDAIGKFESKGQLIEVAAGQKEHLSLKLVSEGDSQ